jgi:hypothetical protein
MERMTLICSISQPYREQYNYCDLLNHLVMSEYCYTFPLKHSMVATSFVDIHASIIDDLLSKAVFPSRLIHDYTDGCLCMPLLTGCPSISN